MEFETVIGLEVHVHLKTETKAFCGCSTEFGNEPNTQTCPVCLGFPGSLPVLNEKALEYSVKVALALNCKAQEFIKFDRKNYFYPDLPKNYQISQYDMPIGLDGFIEIDLENAKKKIRIKRVHLEEDAGKLIHKEDSDYSLVDYNRCGIPLLEIVSEPDINSPLEAFEYLKNLKLIIQYLGVSDCDMEEGSLRCDANISLRPKGEEALGTKTELKNMNSFKGVRLALDYEIKRQQGLLGKGHKITQETRLWDEDKQLTSSMRSKEEAHDYRYFPDPDLVPFTFSKEFIERLKKEIPELPKDREERYTGNFNLSPKEAEVIIQDKDLCVFFEKCVGLGIEPKKIYNWISGPLLAYINETGKQVKEIKLEPQELVELIKNVDDGKLSNLAAKGVFSVMLYEGTTAGEAIKKSGLTQISDEKELEEIVKKVIKENPNSVNDFLSGKENAIMFLVGQAMKLSKGKANPKVVKDIILRRLKNVS
ncbi:MAG: Asp-tRNA(Asn)/Glu-tRNA(Gln) amidotransferase subunit GatB [Candidatus Omnitrophica bacterium]|nr:Asp-tRNA(Asn)/Glu-tRNA(Gln) amidotransferase subunit GatB [Candidatus Omnitrophota bacterium]MDD5352582.1 Asp-tRNA(Asn)/Glu-tRNA(Gln) amidotransferase subunit GatB [Candidatus Omnitrophota bacterium]MDD5550180.1 Asp-tRNA(Asn)/Glu-tRNA(Gln) amidotransferase subunit GatB [Candidatus Omnitrophota bacterium]